jgi:hypothetical protein
MPIYLDSHQGLDVPLEGLRDFLRQARTTLGDAGLLEVRPLDLYCGDDGRVFFVLAAPDEAAVRQHHARQGVVCESVRRVQSLHNTANGLTDEDKAVVRHMIVAERAAPAGSDERLRHAG